MARLVVELTDRCNLRCGHCPSARHGGRGALPLVVLGRVLAQAREAGIDHLSFTGGEPTLHPRFAAVLDLTTAAGLGFGLVTNGWSFLDSLPVLLAHRGRLRMITFSLDGAGVATHDAQRGAGSFRRVMQAVSACVLHGLPFTFNMTLTRHNRGEVAALLDLGAGLGALGVRCGHLICDPGVADAALDLGPAERRALDDELRALQARHPFPLGLAPGGYSADLFPCAALRGEEVSLDWRGRLGWCCQLSGFAGGEAAVVADLHRVDLTTGLAMLDARRAVFRDDKRQRHARGDWRDEDEFPCWYCAKRLGTLEWLRGWPDHPWYGALTGAEG